MLPVTPVINKVTLLNNDTVRALSKEQIEELHKKVEKSKQFFEKQKAEKE